MKLISLRLIQYSFLFVIVFLLFSNGVIAEEFLADKGVLDLRNWNYNQTKIISLKGEWEFYWKELFFTEEIPDKASNQIEYIPVPSNWNGRTNEISSDGYATYHLKILLPENLNESIGLKIDYPPESLVLFLNGKKIYQHGKVGKSEFNSHPSYDSVFTSLPSESKEIELLLHTSNYRLYNGGITRGIFLGLEKDILEKSKQTLSLDLLIIGCLFMMGVYHLGLFSFRRKNLSPLFLALFSFDIALRTSFFNEKYILSILPDLSFDICVRVEYLTYYLGLPLFGLFLMSIFPKDFNKKVIYFFIISFLPLVISCFLFSISIFTYLVTFAHLINFIAILYVIFSLWISLRNRRKGIKTVSFGILIFFIAVTNDMLFIQNIVNTAFYGSYGFIIFIFSQAFALTGIFSTEIDQAEEFAETLARVNPNQRNNANSENSMIDQAKNLETSANELKKLSEIAKQINADLNMETIFKYIISYFKEIYQFEYVMLLMIDKGKNQLFVRMSNFSDEELIKIFPTKRAFLNKELGAIWITYKKKKTLYISNVDKYRKRKYTTDQDDFISDSLNLKSIIHAPLVIKNDIIGILIISSSSPKRLVARQTTMIQAFTDQITGSIYNSILMDNSLRAKEISENEKVRTQKAYEVAEQERLRAEKIREEVERLNDFLNQINSMSNLKEILEEIFDYIENEFGIEFSWLLVTENQEGIIRSSYYNKKNIIMNEEGYLFLDNLRLPLDQGAGILYQIFKRKRAIYGHKIPPLKFFTDFDHKLLEKLNLNSFLGVPLIIKGKILGILLFTNYSSPISLKRNELNRINGFCNQIANALNHTILLNEIQKEKIKVENSKKQIEILNEFSKKINNTISLDSILLDIYNYAKEKYKLEGMGLLLKNPKKNELYTRRVFLPEEFSKNQIRIATRFTCLLNEKDGGIHYLVFKNKKRLFLPRFREKFTNKTERFMMEALGLKSILMIPMTINGETIGILDFSKYHSEISLEKEEIKNVALFCEQITGAIYNNSLRDEVQKEKEKSEKLLLNILPTEIAEQLKEKGEVEPMNYESSTVMFTDFKGFTGISEKLTPAVLVSELDTYFSEFDRITEKYDLEKLKTIGDSYMCAGGIPVKTTTHPIDTSLAALEIIDFVEQIKNNRETKPFHLYELRLGIHTGPVMAGVVGQRKFAYDIWGDTVNTASRMESNGTAGMINISGTTYELVKDFFDCEHRGSIEVKGKGLLEMYYLHRLKLEFSRDDKGRFPNKKFFEFYAAV